MAKTKRIISEQLKVVDVVVEVVDARIPYSSRNPDLPGLIGEKTLVLAMTKIDLADPRITQEWLDHWRREGQDVVALNLTSGQGARPLRALLERIADGVANRMRQRGRQPRPLRILVAGVPNVGKSSLINRLAGKAKARVGAKAGVTRGKQWVRVGNKMLILDTPGILWPKFEDPQVAFGLAVTGAVSDEVFDWQQVTVRLVEYLCEAYPETLPTYYKLKEELPPTAVEVIEAIGRRRGLLMSGGRVDFEKAARLILQDFRSGKLGPMSLDQP
ncbi:MAG: ribosome biogenesis GTPase YlqF [Firmicutes bacterium]|nr:ribosome biogenesis GTPase YlqF [Bacillota bacterium]